MFFRSQVVRFAVAVAVLNAVACKSDAGSSAAGAGGEGSGDGKNGSSVSGANGASGSSAANADGGGGTMTPAQAAMAAATVNADSGFRAVANGFPFPNYADSPGLGMFGATELRRMFGDAVCTSIANDVCVLKPQGQDWADKVNASLQSGHCEGFAVLSLLLYRKWIDATPFGASSASGLALIGNGALNHELAYWYATQFLEDPVITTTHSFSAVDAINYLGPTFDASSADAISRIGIARLDASGAIAGGHAITPYAIVDGASATKKKIMIYDSNHPGEERFIDVDLSTNSWSYVAGTNPDEPASLYSGDTTNKNWLYVAAVHPRLGAHACPFCGGTSAGSSKKPGQKHGNTPAVATLPRTLMVQGGLEPLVTDANGHRVGSVNGVLINEIPGAQIMPGFSAGLWTYDAPISIVLPATGDLSVSVTQRVAPTAAANANDPDAGSGDDAGDDGGPSGDDGGSADAGAVAGADAGTPVVLAAPSVTLFGGGYSLGIDYPAGAIVAGDTIGMPSDASGVSLTSTGPSSATLAMAIETAGGGVVAHVALANLPAGANVGLQTDGPSGTVGVSVSSASPVALELDVGIDKGDGTGQQVFQGGITSDGASAVGVDLSSWSGGTDPLPLTVTPADGSAPTTVVVDNSHDYTPVPVDECTLGTSNCSINATCTDTPASFTCACNDGFSGDGVTCVAGMGAAPAPPAAPAIAYAFGNAPNVGFMVGKMAALQPPSNSGGKIESYSVAPALPAGLVFDTQIGAISGTPTAVAAAASYVVTATNVTGTSSATLSLTVAGPAPHIAYPAGAHALARWATAAPLVPSSTGGSVDSYAIAPALPTGLSFDTIRGTISGEPTVLSAATPYTITATNGSGAWPTTVNLSVVCADGSTSCDTRPVATYVTTVLSDHPVGYWRLADTTSALIDASGNGYDGTYDDDNGVMATGPTLVPGALTNDMNQATTFGLPLRSITGYSMQSVTAFSVEAWINVPNTSSGEHIIFQDRGPGGSPISMTLLADESSLMFHADTDGIRGGATGSANLFDGTWHYVVGTWSAPAGTQLDQSQFTLYIDGVALLGTGTGGIGLSSPVSGGGMSTLGYHQAWGSYFVGSIDEVSVYESVLGPDRIAAHYQAR